MSKLISDAIAAEDVSKWYTSYELYPPRSEKAEEDMMKVLVPNFMRQSPVFLDLTWGAGGRTSDTTMRLCKDLQHAYPDTPINMHITCTNTPKGLINEALDFAKTHGIRNILALRGDPPRGEEFRADPDGFACARDLVRYIHDTYGDYFCVSVAGYPEGHPSRIAEDGAISDEDHQKELEYLKEKVDAGASFIITQLFYDASLYVQFVKRCREIGITVPILAGLLPITTYAGFVRMVSLCKTSVPSDVKKRVEELKENPDGLKEYGVEQCVQMIECIRTSGLDYHHLHFYTLNNSAQTFKVLKRLNALVE
ncbi:methylenetetrahydrofolate reductase (MTHFR) [Leishmania donovani]|uniref:Methylenetetrahydrofolate_reductase_-_putative n=3 Tax=Leishmania donovani species complex TaxID=38574 RepID=A0A6L0XSZ2_LEIIN|nr:putative methylenetetrahydrofolate reductase [Leishmania infantum JPCM5]XP_003865778.1 methylenetetrahydrofolate reductase, putative [Leishmania donovani]CAC9553209.1 methylenetetrahydrofolate_reductase_-_putative [Leishmania infantum]AYU84029.1 methylenetetrahydrofolate reductase, putative [Leishmania donovani]TPP48777.1 methylenetetrahydrofolate reductase [Leishmania donovani]TPP49509.1 methylenetetrahydrofolate reductase [Leishmania donovani]CAJ1994048.1 methylenetetrahydrofolate reduct|eukprot:XP_001469364.1 putative methylenetetrahydrofolate reductase [Leishmania infantum JPCM5]